MAKTKGLQALEARIGSIISDAATAIAAAVREDMADELQQLLAGKSFARLSASGVSRRGGAGQKRNVPKKCISPGCNNPSKGPRWSFLCDSHKNIGKGERKKLLAQWKAQQAGDGEATGAASGSTTAGRKARRGGGRKKAAATTASAA